PSTGSADRPTAARATWSIATRRPAGPAKATHTRDRAALDRPSRRRIVSKPAGQASHTDRPVTHARLCGKPARETVHNGGSLHAGRRSAPVTGSDPSQVRREALSPSMNFRERGQMRQRLRAYLPVRLACAGGLSGRGIPHGPPHWNAGRTADRSRVASPSLTHAPAGRHSLDAAWPRTEALGWRGGAMNKPRGRGAAVSGYYAQVSGAQRARATQEISASQFMPSGAWRWR